MQKSNNFGERGQKAFYLDIEIKNVDTKYEVIIPAGQYAQIFPLDGVITLFQKDHDSQILDSSQAAFFIATPFD